MCEVDFVMALTRKRGASMGGSVMVKKQKSNNTVTQLLNCETSNRVTSGKEKNINMNVWEKRGGGSLITVATLCGPVMEMDNQKPLNRSIDCNKSLSCEGGPKSATFCKKEKTMYVVNKMQKSGDVCSGHKEMLVTDKVEGASAHMHNNLGSVNKLDSQKGKSKGIESIQMQQCAEVLKKLMKHQLAWPFSQPVDPVKLQIPDYFSIISEPMDLGTIKFNLDKKLYPNTQAFVDDVRLTFSNAMLYNPPSNDIHIMARKLSNYFELLWKSLEAKWTLESSKVGPKPSTSERLKVPRNLARDDSKTLASYSNILPKTSMSAARKVKMRKDLVELLKGKISSDLLDRLQRNGLISQNDRTIKVDINAFDDEKLSEWYAVARQCLDSRSTKSVCISNCAERGTLRKDLCEETGSHSRKADDAVNTTPTPTTAPFGGPCIPDPVATDVCRQVNKSGPGYDGALTRNADDESGQHSSCPSTITAAACEEDWEATLNVQLSPSKALRAAKLKERFANTIRRAQTNTLLCNDPVAMQQEKEVLKKQEKEARIRAAAEAELKIQREREREAARIALLQMEKTVEIYEDEETLKDIQKLGYPRVCGNRIGYPLERLGLFLKTDYIEIEEEDEVKVLGGGLFDNLEEGELVS